MVAADNEEKPLAKMGKWKFLCKHDGWRLQIKKLVLSKTLRISRVCLVRGLLLFPFFFCGNPRRSQGMNQLNRGTSTMFHITGGLGAGPKGNDKLLIETTMGTHTESSAIETTPIGGFL